LLSFKWRGHIPHEAVYVLAPFRGMLNLHLSKSLAGAEIARSCEFEANIRDANGRACVVRAKGLAGKKATVTLKVLGKQSKLSFNIA